MTGSLRVRFGEAIQLVKFQRNAIGGAVVAGGLNASECTFEYGDAGARVTHVPSGAYFQLGGESLPYTGTSVVGDMQPQPFEAHIWPRVPERVEQWAREVKGDIETPDFWAEIQRDREILTDVPYADDENTSFTPDEQAEIAEQLRQVEVFVEKTYSLSDTKMRALEEVLDYLKEASRRMGRKDWKVILLGVMFSVLGADLLPPDAVHRILAMVLQGLGHLLGGLGPPALPA